jgi:hypothetical protein
MILKRHTWTWRNQRGAITKRDIRNIAKAFLAAEFIPRPTDIIHYVPGWLYRQLERLYERRGR